MLKPSTRREAGRRDPAPPAATVEKQASLPEATILSAGEHD